MHKIIFLSFFDFGIEGTSQIQVGKKFNSDIKPIKMFHKLSTIFSVTELTLN